MVNNKRRDKRYVAHFDMLGFKTATLRNPDEAWGALSDLRACMDNILKFNISVLSTDEIIENRIRAYIFSDSILIFSLSDEAIDFAAILVLSSHFFADALVKRVPLRGGISYGDFFFNPDLHLFCGIPFVKAYIIGEKAQWSGIVVDDIVAEHYQKHKNLNLTSNGKPVLMQWDVPVKPDGKKKCWVVNWPAIFKLRFKKKPPILVKDFYKAFESLLGPYEDLYPSVKAKYENTVEFMNSN